MKKLTLLPFLSNPVSLFLPGNQEPELTRESSRIILFKKGLVSLKTILNGLGYPRFQAIKLYTLWPTGNQGNHS